MVTWLVVAAHSKLIKTEILELIIKQFIPHIKRSINSSDPSSDSLPSPSQLRPPHSFLPLLLLTMNPELQSIFYSTGFSTSIPWNFTDGRAATGLPFAAILWIQSWFDPVESRAKQFRSAEFTKVCLRLCGRAGAAAGPSLVHLAVVCRCSPVRECLSLLQEAGADLSARFTIRGNLNMEQILHLMQINYKMSPNTLKTVVRVLCSNVESVGALGLAALLANRECLQTLHSRGVHETVVRTTSPSPSLSFFLHSNFLMHLLTSYFLCSRKISTYRTLRIYN